MLIAAVYFTSNIPVAHGRFCTSYNGLDAKGNKVTITKCCDKVYQGLKNPVYLYSVCSWTSTGGMPAGLREGGNGGSSPTGGCVPGGNTCVPCDIGLATHGANCIPSGDWHPGGSRTGTELGGGGGPSTVQQPPPAQNGITEQPPTNLAPDNHKGSNLGQVGGSLLNNDNNNNPSPSTSTGDNNNNNGNNDNNDNTNKPSKHHKGSDALTSPSPSPPLTP
jgi:hypothetical protein